MRKEARKQQEVRTARVQGYHENNTWDDDEAYAFQGFSGNYYFNSDRKIKLDDNFRRADGQPLQGYGLEIETQCTGVSNVRVLAEILSNVVLPKFKFGMDMWKLQRDGSLGGDSSAEIISQVMTESRIRNDYQAYKTMFDEYFPALGISADSYTTSCGMHVNVSNALFGKTESEQIEAIKKLYYIVNRNYTVFCKLFYRCPARTRWCGRMDYSDVRNMNIRHASSSHGNCMNLSHFSAGRIEIRLVGGQKNYYCFRNTMECVFHIVKRVRTISWADCDDLVKIFKGCNQYVMKRLPDCGLDSDTLEAIRATVKPEDLELSR